MIAARFLCNLTVLMCVAVSAGLAFAGNGARMTIYSIDLDMVYPFMQVWRRPIVLDVVDTGRLEDCDCMRLLRISGNSLYCTK